MRGDAKRRHACPAREGAESSEEVAPKEGTRWALARGLHLGVEETTLERPVDENKGEILKDLGSGRHEEAHRASTQWVLVPML